MESRERYLRQFGKNLGVAMVFLVLPLLSPSSAPLFNRLITNCNEDVVNQVRKEYNLNIFLDPPGIFHAGGNPLVPEEMVDGQASSIIDICNYIKTKTWASKS